MKQFELFDSFIKSNKSDDLVVRDFVALNTRAKLVFIDSLVNKQLIDSCVLAPLQKSKSKANSPTKIISEVISECGATNKSTVTDIMQELVGGSCIIFFENFDSAICVPVPGYEKRAISEPPTSAVVKGPREGFTEDLQTNLSMLRRRLKTPSFVVKKMSIGTQTNTQIAVVYLSSVADNAIVAAVVKKLSNIKIDGIIDSFYIEEFLQEKKNSIFKQVGSTEKPDVAVAKLLEGRIGIVVDGSPIVITVPYIFIEDLQSGEDYYSQPARATFLRIIRVFGILIGILLPGFYVATQIFHYRLLPINFLISLLDSVQGLAFPPLIEILFVLFIFDILNEASVRMPKHLGMALSIIGALVLGDTAVQAGLVSPPSILVVAISGITIYTVPDQVGTMSLIRLGLTIIGGIAGYYGLLLAFVFLFWYMCGLQNFGSPYLAPYAPNISQDKKDALIKAPLKNLTTRPKSIPNHNKKRLVASKEKQ